MKKPRPTETLGCFQNHIGSQENYESVADFHWMMMMVFKIV